MFCRNGFTAHGEVNLLGAHIGGSLDFTGASLTNTDGYALNADCLTVDRNMFCREGFTTQGEVRLLGARISVNLEFDGASLTNPNGRALTADGLTVDQSMFCREGFTTHGEVRLLGAHIRGQLSFRKASLSNPADVALDLEGASAGALFLRPQQRPESVVNLTNARVGSFHDTLDSWPEAMWLRGFTYEVLETTRSASANGSDGWTDTRAGTHPGCTTNWLRRTAEPVT
jgi:hypothetical protein